MHTISCVTHLNDELHDLFMAGGINNYLRLWYCILCTDYLKGMKQKGPFQLNIYSMCGIFTSPEFCTSFISEYF